MSIKAHLYVEMHTDLLRQCVVVFVGRVVPIALGTLLSLGNSQIASRNSRVKLLGLAFRERSGDTRGQVDHLDVGGELALGLGGVCHGEWCS